ncbi:hypothetical protein P5V93_24185 [Mycobacteroides abscessus subsp. abscessus]|uniref:hypothetical protein n=2 Tax=Mycobacteroides abscessus TaxID=36809 RepID=UPI0002EEBFE6|nr:hypothetical protein [Mycobacteroides abscessus]MDO3101018.1 hypothetical protein [Mycobacteroides abscessus subsp. abscessus]MDO3184980.1 hypothetical protein [Mycobacteroides abscessus subsp. abscessus]MDO3194397.1 hypothetical protein [Mycobacteroides abscessus subsp. abscessus]MDO3287611.1 hypothetical protein [Mycobacteroides abscessus subsp. abscessus]OLT84703.1 hypothetical protein BKG58_15685 [Mycobacteroides abscessus subsp. abscessus]
MGASQEDDCRDVGALSHQAKVAQYHANIDDDPTELADIYLNFTDFERIEFQVFKQRLSIAVFLARSIDESARRVISRCEEESATDSHRIQGWDEESDLLLENRRGLAEDAAQIGRGAATITAVAALEGLLDDLLDPLAGDPRRRRPRGLQDKWAALLAQTEFPGDRAQQFAVDVKKIADRRNAFAHELTGSYWPRNSQGRDSAATAFTFEELQDTLHTIGHLAQTLEDLLNRT